MPYAPLKIAGFESGLIQEREDYLLPNDGFPNLFNAYVWRNKIVKKRGSESLGRFRRLFTNETLPSTLQASPWSFNLFTELSLSGSSGKELEIGSLSFNVASGAIVLTDQGNGILLQTSGAGTGIGTVDYATGAITITHNQVVGSSVTATFNYYPSLPVMGIRLRERSQINNEDYIGFDTMFSYILTGSEWSELPSATATTWSGSDSDFFWTTNFWEVGGVKLFWATNSLDSVGNPIRYYNSVTWTAFEPLIDATNKLLQAKILIPFRGRMLALNTSEGATLGSGTRYRQRIRWAAIGNPLAVDGWREDIRGKGAYLDIPSSQDIVSAGFVRDNLVIYCERSTWQLRYTGNVIQPFQIERVNTELGVEGQFSSVQFDTSLVGVGDKGIVECDSFKSTRIDQKIPDFAYGINNDSDGVKRVYGFRDFRNRLAFWTYPEERSLESGQYFPNRRLLFNYEDGSWAIFRDSITCMGEAQITEDKTWSSTDLTWEESNFNWFEFVNRQPEIVAGNQTGHVFSLDQSVKNDPSLSISSISGNSPTVTTVTCYDHGLETGDIVEFTGILPEPPPSVDAGYSDLNGSIFQISYIDKDNFSIFSFSKETQDFSSPNIHDSKEYIGGGEISLVDNFEIQSKKFNFLDEGKRIQIGYIDLLMPTTESGAITLEMREDYNPIPLNKNTGDLFFNTVVPTSSQDPADGSTKSMHRVFCKTRGAFLTIVLKLSPAQMNGSEANSNVQVDGIIIWQRPAEKQLYTGEIR